MNNILSENLVTEIETDVNKCQNIKDLEIIKLKYFGKTGIISGLFKKLPNLSQEDKRNFSLKLNEIRDKYIPKISFMKEQFELDELDKSLLKEKLDLTLPSRKQKKGSIHVISKVLTELSSIFDKLGFINVNGPMIEDNFHNFQALNFSENHPSKDMHDTFYLAGGNLLRTHTSTVQIRWMESNPNPPYKITTFGKVYRCDYDSTHTPMFHQFEVLIIDKNINIGDLKTCIEYFLKELFEQSNLKIRIRPSFFPFTEPSIEVDMAFPERQDKWLEILGAGMVHPNVLKNVNLDPTIYNGFALGLGVERVAMLKYGLNDLREFFVGDERWNKIHNFSLVDFLSR